MASLTSFNINLFILLYLLWERECLSRLRFYPNIVWYSFFYFEFRSLLRDRHLTTLSIFWSCSIMNLFSLLLFLLHWVWSTPFSCFEMKMLMCVPVYSSFRFLFYCYDMRRWDNWLWSSFLLIWICLLLSAKYFKDRCLCFLLIFLNPKLSYGSLALLAWIIYLISFWLASSSFEVYEVLLWVKISEDWARFLFLVFNALVWLCLIECVFFSISFNPCY